ncbi:MAG TPA: CBS domain-containing protein [Candidatus Bathyarchaeia archaeon]|nr:CBS domain-containing protein [Candidatus Bathyarchaeia archaeon]
MVLSKEKKVRDVMTRGVITVSFDTAVSETAKLLVKEGVSGIAVTAPDDEVVGVISEIDIIKFFDKDWNTLTAEDIMSTFVRTIDPETTIKKAADIMRDLNIHRLLILSLSPAYGVPIGILTASDILRASVE